MLYITIIRRLNQGINNDFLPLISLECALSLKKDNKLI